MIFVGHQFRHDFFKHFFENNHYPEPSRGYPLEAFFFSFFFLSLLVGSSKSFLATIYFNFSAGRTCLMFIVTSVV